MGSAFASTAQTGMWKSWTRDGAALPPDALPNHAADWEELFDLAPVTCRFPALPPRKYWRGGRAGGGTVRRQVASDRTYLPQLTGSAEREYARDSPFRHPATTELQTPRMDLRFSSSRRDQGIDDWSADGGGCVTESTRTKRRAPILFRPTRSAAGVSGSHPARHPRRGLPGRARPGRDVHPRR
jgi:hypothetical protein